MVSPKIRITYSLMGREYEKEVGWEIVSALDCFETEVITQYYKAKNWETWAIEDWMERIAPFLTQEETIFLELEYNSIRQYVNNPDCFEELIEDLWGQDKITPEDQEDILLWFIDEHESDVLEYLQEPTQEEVEEELLREYWRDQF
jgi:hypothetical protein